jgi:hypothetical protein
MPMTALPTPPSRSDPANFATRADALMTALTTFVTDGNALEANVIAKEASATAQAAAAAASAASALTVAGATQWASGTYATGLCTWSPLNGQTYRRLAPGGASTTDPSADPTGWARLSRSGPWARKTGAYTAAPNDKIKASTTAAAWSLTFPSAPADGDELELIDIDGTFGSNNLTLVCAGGSKIMGYTTTYVLDTPSAHLVFVFDATNNDWRF